MDEPRVRLRLDAVVRAALGLALAGAVVVATWIGWRHFTDSYTVTKDERGQATAQVVSATLFARNDLRVSRLSGVIQGVGNASRLWGWLPSSQVVKAPFTIDYFVPLGRIGLRNFYYDPDKQVMFIEVPDVVPEAANIDLARTTLSQTSGVFVTRGAMAEMARQVSASARAAGQEKARSPENMDKARANARSALENLFGGALRAAGLRVRVEVRFPDETRPEVKSEWNLSRSIAEVYRDFAD